ncbi:hypothetical protein BDY17DRAFT_295513 [Neohortaea acidophila]|uniref:Uncharacterized protein n=1 Tax=Neohortaea acidophila TaxID=245834 RepID=A0A6A6PXD8_9PEZI|nr:uncharacterized protein BDY17DRAFT_295513 [Neohortaea acidophila]KAF2484369.1 hypothetical protein BDY17DRAFT_295513 [Neohortaea acidophila]
MAAERQRYSARVNGGHPQIGSTCESGSLCLLKQSHGSGRVMVVYRLCPRSILNVEEYSAIPPQLSQSTYTVERVRAPRIERAMCYHYAHKHICGHTERVFAQHCRTAALSQRKCTTAGHIWATVKVRARCSRCDGEPLREPSIPTTARQEP